MAFSSATIDSDGIRLVVIDLETTGLEPERDRIVECALIGLDADGQVVEEWSSRIGLPGVMRVGASDLHHLDVDALAGAPKFAELLPSICDRLRGRVVVGHVLAFDVAFLTAECARVGYGLPDLAIAGVCTRDLARSHLVGSSYGLAACCERAGVDLIDAHTALGDARATVGLLTRLVPMAGVLDELGPRARRLVWAPTSMPVRTVEPSPRPSASIRVPTDPHRSR